MLIELQETFDDSAAKNFILRLRFHSLLAIRIQNFHDSCSLDDEDYN